MYKLRKRLSDNTVKNVIFFMSRPHITMLANILDDMHPNWVEFDVNEISFHEIHIRVDGVRYEMVKRGRPNV